MKKLYKGLPIQISFNAMGADKGDVVIGLKEGNAKKLMSAFKKGKGLRMCMDDEELDYTMKSGSGLLGDIKNFGKKVERGVVNVGNKVAKPVKQVISKIPDEQRRQMKSFAMNTIKTSAGAFADMLAAATGEDELADDLEEAIIDIAEELLAGEKVIVGSKIVPLAKRAINTAVDMIEDPRTKATAKAVLKKAGMGLYGKAGGMCGGAITNRQYKKGSQEMRDKMAMVRAAKSGDGLGDAFKSIGKKAAQVGNKAKTAVFGKRMSDEMEFILPTLGGIAGTSLGGLGGMPVVGGVGGTAAGKRLAAEMKKKGMGLSGRGLSGRGLSGRGLSGRGMIKPASDLMTLSPYTNVTAPAFNPFYPKNSFQNGGSGENKGY